MRVCHYCDKQEHLQINCSISSKLLTYDAVALLSTTSILNTNLSTNNTSNLLAVATTHLSVTASGNLSAPTNSNTTTKLTSKWNPKAEIDPTKLEIVDGSTKYAQNPNSQNYLSLLVTPEDAQFDNSETKQQTTLASNISPATITENKSLDTIFPFEFDELLTTPLFSEAALEEKLITAMYTDAKINSHSIKLILDSRSAGSIIIKQLINQLGYQIDYAISARIITTNRATKTSIGKIDDFSIEVNSIIMPIKVLVIKVTQYQTFIAMCGHFKITNLTTLLIEKQREEFTWETDNNNNELTLNWEWKEDKRRDKEKGKEKDTTQANNTYILTTYAPPQHKKLLLMGICCGDDKEYTSATKFYCHPCILKCFGRPKQVGKWDNEPCLACGKTLLDKRIWNNIPGRGETCDESSVKRLNSCPHNNDKIWQMALAKIEGISPEEIRMIKNNPSKPIELD
ncbi:hypothetical protein G9A89_017407 [Geosiphon pyriformis]|nr:hypothetical protein G9A89_017407 [Geosiphon pyriformis]